MRRAVIAQSEVHSVSKLVAAVEDDGYSGHLYLAKSGKTKRNLAFFWIYNRGPAPTDDTAIGRGQNQHWEAWKGVAGPQARCPIPEKSVWTFIWSIDGESLVLAQDGKLVVFVDEAVEDGFYCRHLIGEFQWCFPWTDAAYQRAVNAIRPATAFDRRMDRLTAQAMRSGKCTLQLAPLAPEVDPLRFGRAKRQEKFALADHLKHPIWVSAHDDRHDEEWYKPIVSTTDVSQKVLDHDVPIITVKVEGSDLAGTAYYFAEGDSISDVVLSVGRKWQPLREVAQVKYPAVLVAVPSILGQANVRFQMTKPDDNGRRMAKR
jgi:hypothetical protein